MSEHYLITANQGHLRIFQHRRPPGQTTPAYDEVQALDFPAGVKGYTSRETDMAGRFQGSKHQSNAPGAPMARSGMSTDERLPMQREEERRRAREIAETVDGFLQSRPAATWDFAAGPGLHTAVVEFLSPAVRDRLKIAVSKDLVHQPTSSLQTHFAH